MPFSPYPKTCPSQILIRGKDFEIHQPLYNKMLKAIVGTVKKSIEHLPA
jgi:hypothetical protein